MIKKGRRKRKLHDSFYLINSESLSFFSFFFKVEYTIIRFDIFQTYLIDVKNKVGNIF